MPGGVIPTEYCLISESQSRFKILPVMALHLPVYFAVLSGSAMAAADSHEHWKWSWPWESSNKDDSSSSGDFMDKYIFDSKEHKAQTGLDGALASFDAKKQMSDASAGVSGDTSASRSSSSSSQGSASVVDVRLSSELQQSLLQSEGNGMLARSLQKSKNAPNVEDQVAKERQMDVYIHDGFGEEEKNDVKYVKEVNSNKNMKP